MKRTLCLALIFVTSILMGCATTTKEWVSNPVSRTAENNIFKAQLEPGKEGKRTFVSFRLVLVNKTGDPIKIDWNQTRYLLNGKPNGRFWFRGIDPRTIKDNIPPDIIPGGSRLEKLIFPVKLVAFAPIQDDTLRDGGPGIYPGPMPQGENGIYLVVTQNGKKITEKLVFIIVAESMGAS
jgi:hypothetical protein